MRMSGRRGAGTAQGAPRALPGGRHDDVSGRQARGQRQEQRPVADRAVGALMLPPGGRGSAWRRWITRYEWGWRDRRYDVTVGRSSHSRPSTNPCRRCRGGRTARRCPTSSGKSSAVTAALTPHRGHSAAATGTALRAPKQSPPMIGRVEWPCSTQIVARKSAAGKSFGNYFGQERARDIGVIRLWSGAVRCLCSGYREHR
jgi:hypothetical protein